MSADITLGPMEIGVLVSSVIYGVICHQSYLYFVEHSKNDQIYLKTLVAVLMVLETFHTGLLGHTLYMYSVKALGDVEEPTEMTWSHLVEIVVAAALSTITQFFFARRLYHLNGRRLIIPLIICLLSTISLGLAIGFVTIGFMSPSSYLKSSNRDNVFAVIGSFAALILAICDLVITIGTIRCFRDQNNRSQLASTTRVINRMIRYTLNTGLGTTIFALLAAITGFAYNSTSFYAPFYFLATRLYACSLVSILNSRSAVQREFKATSNTRMDNCRSTIPSNIGFSLSHAVFTDTGH